MKPTYEELRMREEWREVLGKINVVECDSCGGYVEKGAAVCPLCHSAIEPED